MPPLAALLLACTGCASTPAPATVALSPAATMEDAGMVDIRSVVPDMGQDIRYFGSENFVGRQVDGYGAPDCWLKREAAEALARVETTLRESNQRLRVFDCYRPARAVAHFMRWVEDPNDLATKPRHYPDLDKSALPGVYIGRVSGHSRGATVDLTLLQCDATGNNCTPLDMGTEFDFFGARANTDSPEATPAQHRNRYLLRDAMAAQGFRNYPMEWWHYTFQPEPTPGLIYDVPIQ
ncbi:MAG: M15 family metallopeptidase [Pseudomonadota bacterium]